jgi:hypothetical protein
LPLPFSLKFRLPLSKGFRFTENTAEIRIGEGLWVGASEAPTTFKIYAVDPASNQWPSTE